jgi:hypothetical protein
MSNGDRLAEYANPCTAPWRMMEIATAFCLAPVLDQGEGEPDPESAELARDIGLLKRELDIMFSDDVRRQLVIFLRQINANKELYRRTLLLWLDLTEEIAFQVEKDLGDNTGPVKLSRVRGGVFYLLTKFSEGLEVPNVPRFFNRLFIHLVIRGTVEFIVNLVNIDRYAQRTRVAADLDDLGLWNKALRSHRRAESMKSEAIRKSNIVNRATHTVQAQSQRLLVTVEKQRVRLWDRIADFILDLCLAPPKVPSAFKTKIDAIVAQMNHNRPTDMPPVTMMGKLFFDIVHWIGQHGKEIRAAIDALAIAVHQTQRLGEMTRERRIQVIEDALILYFAELGLSGPYFRFVLRLLVDINLDALIFLYEKRGVIADEAPA